MTRPHWTTFARGKRRERGTMNGTERAYAEELRLRQMAGEVAWFEFESLSFRIGEGAHYKPDFLVMLADGSLECHEVKGFWAEAAKVRIKVAADRFPFRFVAVKKQSKKKGGGWSIEEF